MKDLLNLTWQIEIGEDAEDRDPENPLSRALNRLFVDGKPIEAFSITLFHSGAMPAHLRWLGIFVLGKRIIFFPALSSIVAGIQTFRGRSLQNSDSSFVTDHLSLEPDLRSWHATTPGSGKHLSGGKTVPLSDGRYLWFGMSVSSEDVLRPIRKKTIVSSTVPSGDAKRRTDVFMKARENAIYPIVLLNEKAPAQFDPAFLHFAFVVGKPGLPNYTGEKNFFLPFGSPFVSGEARREDLQQLPVRSHRMRLGQHLELEIVSMCLPGTLSRPMCLTSLA